MERQAAEAVGGLANHHGVHVQGAQVGRPVHLLQQLGQERCAEFGNPLLVAKALAQFAHLEVEAKAVVRLAAPHVALVLQGLQQAAHGGAVQAGQLGQLRRAGAAVHAVEGVEDLQATGQAAYGLVFGFARTAHLAVTKRRSGFPIFKHAGRLPAQLRGASRGRFPTGEKGSLRRW
ncbi:hypothetical protein D9M71_563880 [compost metagenome]